jgi:trehalose synthase
VQKSLAEGFGLTVAEAMWKARPVVASRIGGIQDQIVHGESGLLLDNPRDLPAYGAAVTELLEDPERAERIGHAARERVREKFISPRSLLDYLGVIRKVLARPRERVPA